MITIYIFIFFLGISIGSFLNVLIYRVPRGLNIAYPSSHCPSCKNPLKWWHNIPLLSWLFLQGKCYFCKTKISFRYPLVELLTGLIFLVVFAKNGVNLFSLNLSLVFSLLLALSLIDFEYKAVPDSINLTALSLSFFSSPDVLENIKNALILAGAFSFLRFYVSYYVSLKENLYIKNRLKQAPWLKSFYPAHIMVEALGEGDIIVAGTIGAILGLKLSLVAIFLSAFLAIFPSLYLKYSKRDMQLPYIPFLALALFIVYIFDHQFNSIISGIING